MSCLDSCRFQQILDITSSVKITLFTLNRVSFVRNTCPTISSLYYKLMTCLGKTSILKVDITEKQPIKSV